MNPALGRGNSACNRVGKPPNPSLTLVEAVQNHPTVGGCHSCDAQRIEDAVLAQLGAFEFEHGRAWKRFDFSVMEALAEKGLMSDPRGWSESVRRTPEGLARSKAMAQPLFGSA